MAFVIQRTGGKVWYAAWKGRDGNQIRRSTGLAKKAAAFSKAQLMENDDLETGLDTADTQRAYAKILRDAARDAESGDLNLARAETLLRRIRALANPDFREVTVCGWFAEWVERQRPTVAPSTLSGYEDGHRRMKAALGPRKASKPLSSLTTGDVHDALVKIAETVKAATANMDLHALRRALETAKSEKLVSDNVGKVVKPLPENDSTERAPFTAAEVRTLINTAGDDETRGLIIIAAHTGIRMGDVIKLGTINVDGTNLVIRPAKTKRKKKTIIVPMTPPILGWIGKREGAFFPALAAKTKATNSSNFTRLMKKAGVPREITLPGDVKASRSFHSLRHSFTSWLAEADIHADVRQKLTGHSSAGVHSKYTHLDEALARAVGMLPLI